MLCSHSFDVFSHALTCHLTCVPVAGVVRGVERGEPGPRGRGTQPDLSQDRTTGSLNTVTGYRAASESSILFLSV